MTKTVKKSVAFLSAAVMFMAMLLYFPGGTFSNIDFGLKASAEEITPSQPTEGDGSEDKPYQIDTKEELYWFAQQVNGVNTALNAVLTANITVNTGVLKTDGSLADDTSGFTSWTPIGNDLNPYTGTFDGQNHKISGLYHSSGSDYVGLFGYVGTNGSVSNVGVVDSYFEGSNAVGGVCGNNHAFSNGTATIKNCYNTGYVSGTGDMVGGVCGYNYASSSGTATIENCYNTGAVSGNFYVGGVCGWNYASNGIATIKNCYNTGEVSGTSNGVGGVCGYNFAYDGIATITKCYYLEGCNAVGTSFSCTEGTSKSSEEFESGAVCELVGYHSPQASNDFKCIHCEKYDDPKKVSDTHHSELNITHKDYYAIENASQLYWFAGLVNGDSKVCTGSVNKNTGAKAVLTADITVNTDVLNENGELNATNANTFKEWTPIGNEDNKYTGTFDGNGKTISGLYFNDSGANYVGLFGYSSGTIKNVGVVDSYFNGKENVGGVCGYNNGGTIENCYNRGTVSGSGNCVGGVCGFSTGTITNCYNTGDVGGVCGYNYGGTFKNCYYLAESETDIIDGTTFKTTAQFESGEVAYLLSKGENGSIWGQTLTGDNKQDYPVLGGTKVYQVNVYEGCEGNPGEPSTAYSNTNAPVYVDHDDTNGDGMCDYCDKLIHSVVKKVSATLDGDIGLNYYIALPESVTADTGAYVQFTVNGQDTKVFVKDVTDIEGSVYKFTCWLTAKEMSDDVTFKLYDGNGTLIDIYSNSGDKVEGASFDYSLETYLNTLSSDENAALKDLADATLVYGAYAQNAFNHNADPNLDGSELADVTVGTLEANKITKSADIPEGLKLTEMTLILETETTLRLYFKSDNIGNYTFKLDGNDVTLNTIAEEGLYYVEIANISAKDLDTKHTLIINDNCELTFNALSYAYATVKADTNENICNVVKAL